MEGINGACALGVEKLGRDVGDIGDGVFGGRHVGGKLCRFRGGKIVPDAVRNDEVAVGQALHEGAGAETVGTVIGEIGFAENEEAGNRGHQVVVDPEASHGVVRGGI